MTRYLAYCKGDILLTREGCIPTSVPKDSLKPWNHVTKLQGSEVSINKLDSPVVGNSDYQMVPLRKAYPMLSHEDYALASKGAELLYWDNSTRFCGCCGGENHWMTDISKKCRECGKEWWPSPSVAIIVRITRGDEILLVHAKNFHGNHYGLVAGFVETGESLEETVHREVMEETGINITNLRYFSSQPWPFPFGLMVGFTADYHSGDIHLQKQELTAGGWFTRDNLPEIPDKASIARWLIDDFVGHSSSTSEAGEPIT